MPDDIIVGKIVDHSLLQGVEDVHLQQQFAYLPCREGQRLTICDISDASQPTIAGTFAHSQLQQVAGCAINGDLVYLASHGNQTLMTVDVSDKAHPKFVSSLTLNPPGGEQGGLMYKVSYADGHCYVAHQSAQSVFIVDVNDPFNPRVQSVIKITTGDDGPFSVMLIGDVLLTGTIFGKASDDRVVAVDVKDKSRPKILHTVADPRLGYAGGGTIEGDTYFVAGWSAEAIVAVDVSLPSKPEIVGALVDERIGKPNRCIVSDSMAFVPMYRGGGVSLVDVSDPHDMKFRASFWAPDMERAYSVAVRDGHVYAGARRGNSLTIMSKQALLALG